MACQYYKNVRSHCLRPVQIAGKFCIKHWLRLPWPVRAAFDQ